MCLDGHTSQTSNIKAQKSLKKWWLPSKRSYKRTNGDNCLPLFSTSKTWQLFVHPSSSSVWMCIIWDKKDASLIVDDLLVHHKKPVQIDITNVHNISCTSHHSLCRAHANYAYNPYMISQSMTNWLHHRFMMMEWFVTQNASGNPE